MKDFLGKEHSRVNIVENFEHDFVVYLTKNITKGVWSKLGTILEENEVVEFHGLKSTFLAGFNKTDKQKGFALGMDNSHRIICNKTVYPSVKKMLTSHLKTGNWSFMKSTRSTLLCSSKVDWEIVYARVEQKTEDI